MQQMGLNEITMELPAGHMTNVFGQFDAYLKKIERAFQVTVICREGQVKILGDAKKAAGAQSVFAQLLELSGKGNEITEQNVDYAIALVFSEE